MYYDAGERSYWSSMVICPMLHGSASKSLVLSILQLQHLVVAALSVAYSCCVASRLGCCFI